VEKDILCQTGIIMYHLKIKKTQQEKNEKNNKKNKNIFFIKKNK
jgi:hypothetical protein